MGRTERRHTSANPAPRVSTATALVTRRRRWDRACAPARMRHKDDATRSTSRRLRWHWRCRSTRCRGVGASVVGSMAYAAGSGSAASCGRAAGICGGIVADSTRCPCGEDHPCWRPLGAVSSPRECFCVLPQGHDGPCKCDHSVRRAESVLAAPGAGSKGAKAAAEFERTLREVELPASHFGRNETGS